MKSIKAALGENNIWLNMAIEKVFEQIPSYHLDNVIFPDQYLTEDKVKQIIDAAQSRKTKLIIQFLFKTSCRVSEMSIFA